MLHWLGSSFNDSATLRRASSAAFKGSTAGSFTSSHGLQSLQSHLTAEDIGGEAAEAAPRGLPALRRRFQFGYLLQYFAVGVVYGGVPATTYGFLLGYLNVPAYVYNTCVTMLTLPWSFKFVLGAINDCVPIFGYRRKPYMAFGWFLCASMLLLLYVWPMPPPYYCVNATTGSYILEEPPCNPESARAGAAPTLYMMGACLGYVVVDVAADGLTVQYARGEPEDRRGYTQTTCFIWRSIGQVVACSLVGVGMNGKLYLGTWDASLSYNEICLALALVAAAMVPISLVCIEEPRLNGRVTFREYWLATWELLRSKAFFCVVLWQFFNPAIQYVHSTAYPLVGRYWAGVEALQNQIARLISYTLFSVALWVVREHFLQASWRRTLIVTTVSLFAMDAPFALLTTYDVLRSQYFYLSENLVTYVPGAIFLVVSCFVVVEVATDNNEGLVYGLLSTIHNCGESLPTAVSNQLFGALFSPALSNSANYIPERGGDQLCFRRVVAYSFLVGYAFAAASLVTMPLLPDQRADARFRMNTWPRRTSYALATVALLVLGLGYSITVNAMVLTPFSCMRLFGGQGCNATQATNAAESC